MGNQPVQGRITRTAASLLVALVGAQVGCTRAHYFRQANKEAYALIAEKSNDSRWCLPRYTVEPDPRSRYFDPCNPICPPMPPDDPASHEFMHCVDGMRGSRRWDDYGFRRELENPSWRECLGEYVDLTDDGAVKLSLESAVRMAYVNSPDYQEQLETLYLSALDVSTERFRYDVRFFGGNGTTYTDSGGLRSGFERPELGPTKRESSELRTDTDFQLRRKFATAGELLVGFANSFVWQFVGPDSNTMAASLLNFTLVQPLLRAGGRVIALEQLTIAERTLLGNLRAFRRYCQGFFTDIAIGDSGVSGPQRRGGFFGGTGLTGFTGQGAGGFGGVGGATGFGRAGFGGGGVAGGGGAGAGFAGGGAGQVGGFIGLLQQLQQIHNTQESLNAQLRSLRLLEAHLEAGTIDLTQVDQFRQSIETERANLLQSRNSLENSLDSFKRSTLGLPPDLPLELDDGLIRQFQFIDPQVSSLQYEISDFLEAFGELPAEPELDTLRQALDRLATLRGEEAKQFRMITSDLEGLKAHTEAQRQTAAAEKPAAMTAAVERLKATFTELQQRFDQTDGRLQELRDQLTPDTRGDTADQVVELVTELASIIDELSLVQARARMETVTVQPVVLDPHDALDIARANRLDWMNNRAALVDTWRLIAFNANALRSNLDVVFEGDMGTVGRNPIEFRAPTGSLEVGVRFDAPFTRLLERNNFRQVLIDYQRDRRQLIQFEDAIHQNLRQLLRLLEQHAVNLEIQRRAVAIAIRRVDETREVLNEPPPPSQPGQPATQLGPTAALNLMTALSDLRSSQNNFMSVWLNFYATRMQLERELGIMELEAEGMWLERPLFEAERATAEEVPLPPAVPEELWIDKPELEPPDQPPDELPDLPIPMTSHPQNEGDLASPPLRKLARSDFSLM